VGRCGVGQKQNAPQIAIYQIVFAHYSIDYTTISKFIKFDHQPPCHGGWRSNRRATASEADMRAPASIRASVSAIKPYEGFGDVDHTIKELMSL
jgi:hypothetical protein